MTRARELASHVRYAQPSAILQLRKSYTYS